MIEGIILWASLIVFGLWWAWSLEHEFVIPDDIPGSEEVGPD